MSPLCWCWHRNQTHQIVHNAELQMMRPLNLAVKTQFVELTQKQVVREWLNGMFVLACRHVRH